MVDLHSIFQYMKRVADWPSKTRDARSHATAHANWTWDCVAVTLIDVNNFAWKLSLTTLCKWSSSRATRMWTQSRKSCRHANVYRDKTKYSQRRQTSPPVPPPGKSARNIRVVFDSVLFRALYEDMTSSTKPEVHIVSHALPSEDRGPCHGQM